MIDRKRRRKKSSELWVRIGAVGYLNSKPLVEGLHAAPRLSLSLDYPSRLADQLSAGQLDVALIPSIESFSDPDYEVISDACVAARGPVMSVKLYFRRRPGDVESLALDAGSRTSAALARIMLAERFGATPRVLPLPLDAAVSETPADAVLLIGDRAMHPLREQFVEVWDLGDEWCRWTGLPFVFAMWVARRCLPADDIARLLEQARDLGVSRIAEIAAREAGPLGLSRDTAFRYLTRNLHFRLGAAERSGLRLFHRLALEHGLVSPSGAAPRRSRAIGVPA